MTPTQPAPMSAEELALVRKIAFSISAEPETTVALSDAAVFGNSIRYFVPRLLETIAALTTWHPMDTAPTDGTRILIWVYAREMTTASCGPDGKFRDRMGNPIYGSGWMPTPETGDPQ